MQSSPLNKNKRTASESIIFWLKSVRYNVLPSKKGHLKSFKEIVIRRRPPRLNLQKSWSTWRINSNWTPRKKHGLLFNLSHLGRLGTIADLKNLDRVLMNYKPIWKRDSNETNMHVMPPRCTKFNWSRRHSMQSYSIQIFKKQNDLGISSLITSGLNAEASSLRISSSSLLSFRQTLPVTSSMPISVTKSP